ncbi:unnamed protein product [Mucor hiemalis]
MAKSSKYHSDHQQAQSSSSGEGPVRPSRHVRDRAPSEEEGSNEELDDYDTDLDYGTPIRSRIRFTLEQTKTLEETYQKNKRPSSEAKQKLALRFNTTIHRIQIWFQNRRAKEKKSRQSGANQIPDGAEASTSETEGDLIADISQALSRNQPSSSSKEKLRKGKSRKMSEEYEPYYPVQLHSDGAAQQHSQPTLLPNTYPFYQDGKGSTAGNVPNDYHHVMPNIPTVRRVTHGFTYPHAFGKVYYHMASPTMNPQDMIYRHSDSVNVPGYVEEPYTPPEEREVSVDHAQYFVNDPSLGTIVDVPSGSTQTPPDGTTILAHEEGEHQISEREGKRPKKDRKGKGKATRPN